RNVAKRCTGSCRQPLPGNQVRVMLGFSDEDLVAGLEREALGSSHPKPRGRLTDAERNGVQRVRRPGRPHDLLRCLRADESGDRGPCCFEALRGTADRLARAAVNGRVVSLEKAAFRVQHPGWSLRGCGGIEVRDGYARYLRRIREIRKSCAEPENLGSAERRGHRSILP